MDSKGMREAIREALKKKGRGYSVRTMQYEVAEIRTSYPGATQKQAWLVFAHEQGIDVGKYEDDKAELKEVREIVKMRASSGAAIQREVTARRGPTVAVVREPLPKESFPFVFDPKVRVICQRDYKELQKVRRAKVHKSTIILSGGLLEALLLDVLKRRPTEAKASYKELYQGKKTPSMARWKLEQLIAVAEDLGIITQGASQLSQTLREYRNLVHAAKEIRSGYKVKEEEAGIAFHMVKIVMRELKRT